MIDIENVTFQYEDAVEPALRDVSLHIKKGEFLAVVGHNGSGKSTLARHLNALLLPTNGAVRVEGMNTKDEENTLPIRQKVGIVFQNPDNQIVTTVVEEDVAFGPENIGVPPEEIRKRVDNALLAVGMEEFAARAPHMLSGGQKQRIAIAGMIAMEPEVLVLDEATAMLDPKGRRDILSVVSKLHREKGITVVMITQYMEEATAADRVAVMSGGRLILCGTPEEVFRETELLRQHRLDVPAMTELKERLNAAGAELPDTILTVEDMADAICRSLLKN
ncbi:MAG: energy-coupling factor transporter ATPase [Clostridia bacterium]|nr:energy-coupling factor transporter ATPase [Clostridia bacterium]